jgi:hypothetical protein
MHVVLVDVVATADKRGEGGPLVCTSVAQMTNVAQRDRRRTNNELLAVRRNCCSPRLFRGLSSTARVEYMPVTPVGVLVTADKREEGGPLVCPSVAQMSLSVAADERVTSSWLSVGTAALHACSAV